MTDWLHIPAVIPKDKPAADQEDQPKN
jgi:hypothetical protein